ncbi:MAG: HAMP domain-containing protein [Deltaproteobacteria bacterium]|nr:HAMP domain-containing protein [Deltaproteobacteria bacterium]
MRLKLSKSFIFLIGSVLLAGISALLYFDYRTNSILLEEVGLGQAAKLANAISDQLHTAMRLGGGRHENRAIIERFSNIDGIEDIRIIHGPSVDRQYGVELDEVPTDALDMKALEGAPALNVVRSQNGYMVARNVMPSFFEKSCLGCHVGRPGDVAGAVSVSVSMKEYERIVAGHSVKFFIGGGGILIMTSLVVLMLVHRRLLEPLEKLRVGALELARGRFGHRVGISSGDEFEELGDAFDSMAASLSAASEDLSELGGKYSRLVDMAADAILLRDIETGLYAESNQAASVLSGYTRDELMKMCPADLFPLSKLSEYNQAVLRWVHDEKGFLHDAMVIKKEGFLVPVEISASLIEIKGKKFIQEIWRDVSERKGLEETIRRQIGVLEETVRVRTSELNSSLKELEEAYRRLKSSEQKLIQSAKLISLGEMGAGIAHELNSPLAGILSITEVLLSRTPKDDRNYFLFEKVKDAAVRSKYIILDMLTYSKPSREGFAPIYLNECIRATLTIFTSEIKTRSIEISECFDPALPRVFGNKGQIMEVVLNILKNARDAMAGSGTLFISTCTVEEGAGKYAVAEFRDTGPGITPEVMDSIFDPFFTTKEKGGGHNIGLGLSISISIIKEHGGTLEASNSPDGGAVFRVRLPVYSGV